MTGANNKETHPFEPFFPNGAKYLMCGTFPARPEKWSMKFYYPNFQNDMWRIFGIIFFNDKNYFVDEVNKTYKLSKLKDFLRELGLALSDTGSEIIRLKGNASDKDLKIEKPIDIQEVLCRLPEVDTVITTGKLASEVLAEVSGSEPPKMGGYTDFMIEDAKGRKRNIRHWRMPSTSRAYPMKIDEKAKQYAKCFVQREL